MDILNTIEKPTEKIYVTPAIKRELTRLKEPHERYGDVIARVMQERKREDLIAHLDRIAREGVFVPLDSDPEYAELKKSKRKNDEK